jgi:bacterioferritin
MHHVYAIKSHTQDIKQTGDVNDFATREIPEGILNNEDAHMDKIEEPQEQIEQMSLQIFLSTRT